MAYQFQAISKSEIAQHKEALMEFFDCFRYAEDYSVAIDSSACICVCWLDKKIVGAGRLVSDLSRFGFIVDLNVKKAHQKKGIGKQLVKNLVQACLDQKISYIELSTDPHSPWLEDFYKKIGFDKISDSVLMGWPRKDR